MSLILTYQGWSRKYFHFYCENLDSLDGDDDFCTHYKVREDLANLWTVNNDYVEGVDFSIEVQMNEEFLLVPYVDPNQLTLFDPVNQ